MQKNTVDSISIIEFLSAFHDFFGERFSKCFLNPGSIFKMNFRCEKTILENETTAHIYVENSEKIKKNPLPTEPI